VYTRIVRAVEKRLEQRVVGQTNVQGQLLHVKKPGR
jgi:hypothetical protein